MSDFPSSSVTSDENNIIKVIETISLQQIAQNLKQGEKPVRRDAHAKHHGCVKAEFVVEDNLPEEMKAGGVICSRHLAN